MNSSGVWNVPFYIKDYNIDRFPLSEPVDTEVVTIPEFPSDSIFVLFSVACSLILLTRKVRRHAK